MNKLLLVNEMLVKKVVYFIFFSYFLFSESLAREYIIIQSTTSLENSGLLNIIEKEFENKFQIDIRFVAVGTGQAIINAKNGDSDILMIHSEEDEINFIEEGYGLARHKIMYNDFIIIGPTHDPAGLRSANDVVEAMQMLTLGRAPFLSRGDNSGTHKKELSLWRLAEIEIKKRDKWYLENGLGMGITINMASEMDAYTIADRGTWLSYNKKEYLDILFEKDELLYNTYGVIVLNPNKFPHVKYENSMIFINWLLSNGGKSIINGFKLNGQQLFFAY